MADITAHIETEGIPTPTFFGRDNKPITNVRLLASHGVYGLVFSGGYAGEQQPTVAIKVLKRDWKNPAGRPALRDAFREEVKTLEALTAAGSTHTPTVHSFYDDDSGSPYFVMDLARGISLDNLTFHPSFATFTQEESTKNVFVTHYSVKNEQTALEITIQLLETLKIADQIGYAYRDWKAAGGDMYWDIDQKHLTIIDFGITERSTPETRLYTILKSLQVLYSLVTNQIFLGEGGPGVDEEGKPVEAWEAVSPGLRRILKKGFSQNEKKDMQLLTR